MKNKQSNKKTPTIWTWIAFGFSLIMLFVLFNTIASEIKQDSSVKQISKEEKQISKEEMEQKVNRLRADMSENINKEVGNMFTDSLLEHITENNFKLTLTIEDDWYYLEKFQQERLLENAWRYFNSLGVKYGLREPDDMPWKVIFIDAYEKELAEKGW